MRPEGVAFPLVLPQQAVTDALGLCANKQCDLRLSASIAERPEGTRQAVQQI